MAVVTSFANVFPTTPTTAQSSGYGSVPGVAQTSSAGVGLQGRGTYNNSTISVPKPTASSTFGDVPSFPNGSVIATGQPKTGVAPSFRQVYNGTVYTNPTALAAAQAADLAKQSTFSPINYGGQLYTDPTSYANKIISDVKAAHDQAVSAINKAHDNGLIDFDTRQKLIDQNRQNLQTQAAQALDALKTTNQNTLDSQASYFSNIAPDAYESTQKTMADNTNNLYNQDVNNLNTQTTQANQALDTSAGQLSRDQQDFETNYQNSLKGADQSQQQGIDQANNLVLGNQQAQQQQQQKIQQILDAGKQSSIDFANQQANYAASAAPTTQAFNPLDLAQTLASQFVNANSTGINADAALPIIKNQLQTQGFNPAQTDPIIQYAYNLVTAANPNSNAYASAYNKKSPIQIAATGQ